MKIDPVHPLCVGFYVFIAACIYQATRPSAPAQSNAVVVGGVPVHTAVIEYPDRICTVVRGSGELSSSIAISCIQRLVKEAK